MTNAFDPRNKSEEFNQSPGEHLATGDDELTEADFAIDGEEDDDDVDWGEQDDTDDNDSYGSSGEKYGWYNGWSDDAIDDAFEGDPENTWNVD